MVSSSPDVPNAGVHYEVHTAGNRRRVGSGGPFEARIGYSRLVQVGRQVWVSGTTATGPDGQIVGPGDPIVQTQQTLANIERALAQVGGGLADVVRLRIYVVGQEHWPAVGQALGAVFGAIRPAATMVGVAWLVDPAMLVEIEVDALLDSGPPTMDEGELRDA